MGDVKSEELASASPPASASEIAMPHFYAMHTTILLLLIFVAIDVASGQNRRFDNQQLIVFQDLAPALAESDLLKRFTNLKYSVSARVATVVTVFVERPSEELQNEYAVFEITSAPDGSIGCKAQQVRLRKQHGLDVGSGTYMLPGSETEGSFNNIRVASAFLLEDHKSDAERDAASFLCSPWLPNARHTIQGKVKLLGYQFVSEPQYPLTFKLVKSKVYVYLSGRGTVTRGEEKPYNLGTDDSTDRRLELIASRDQLVREGAALALGYLSGALADSKKTIKELINALQDDIPDVRIAAAESLGRLHAKESTEQLRSALSTEKNNGVRLAIEKAIEDALGKE
jgi:hypothetical protein